MAPYRKPPEAPVPPAAEPARPVSLRRWSLGLPTGWPLSALYILYPLWWALGLPTFIYAILAVPMAFHLYRRGNVRVPPGFGFWLVLIAWVVFSGIMLDLTAPNMLTPQGFGRYIGWGIRIVNYTAVTILMLYVINLSEREMSRRRLVRLLGYMSIVTIIGGYVGAFKPSFHFVAPLKFILPGPIASDPFVNQLMHVEVAQVQDVLEGESSTPRPSAPFEYTNSWGENSAIVLIWLIVGWVVLGGQLRRIAGLAVALAAVFPIVYSLNRGLWIGLGLAVVYVAIRLALRGRMAVLAGLALAVGLLGILIVASPLGSTLAKRAENGHSNDIRATLNAAAVQAANRSPILGYGANRALLGSGRSIAIGKSDDCKQCGNREIGSDGHFWHLLVAQGYVGAFCYSAFFLACLWRYRRDNTPIGIAGSLVIILILFFQFLYGALPSTIAFGAVSIGLLMKNDAYLRAKRAAALTAKAADEPPPGLRGRIVKAGAV
jgi:O-Antigen ligase